jgi:hypothetical protein
MLRTYYGVCRIALCRMGMSLYADKASPIHTIAYVRTYRGSALSLVKNEFCFVILALESLIQIL